MPPFKRPEHRIVGATLAMLRREFMLENQCWFGGGTAIVLKLDEYRLSMDMDFLCADRDGYRTLRTAATQQGVSAFFDGPVQAVRDFHINHNGLRTILELDGQTIKFEIVIEGRIPLAGMTDPQLGVPTLTPNDLFAEKLLANADRCYDRAVAYRDAIDLGMMVRGFGPIPAPALAKATAAYGPDIRKKLIGILTHLQDGSRRQHAASALGMEQADVTEALVALERECLRLWPDLSPQPSP